MARNRQRAKQRQAERRARQLGGDGKTAPERSADSDSPGAQSAPTEESEFELESNAPPEELGRSDLVLEPAPDEPDLDEEYEDEDYEDFDDEDSLEPDEAEEAEAAEAEAAGREPRPDRDPGRDRGKVTGFLVNVWAELQRVQWPNRQQVTTLTGVVIGFVLIAGGYLGLLDAIFSRVIEAIL